MSIPSELRSLELVTRLKRAPSEHKGNAGKVLLVGGAPGMAGALLLSGSAALHLGAGWTILEMLDPTAAHAMPEQAELMVRLASFNAQEQLEATAPDVIAIGPGLGFSALARDWLVATLHYPNAPVVIDADALNLIADTPEYLDLLKQRNQAYPGMSVLTPHPGEAAHLLNTTSDVVQANRLAALSDLITLTNSIVALKGQHTLIGSPLNAAMQCQQGNPGMAVGGMGDVLTGSIAAIAAQGLRHDLNLWEASCIGVQLHASAADSLVAKEIGPIGLTPTEVILEMRSLLNKLL
ncbi:NAD(P)H-hydrate dehydratase [Polynucleobacter sp. AP-Jannik-300A-C4]|uniref:NAD(P)H-hydrate dehydratase n=1 Tax=Polynucleobacter sp. AP-Jannik-300A-C4 TaxID=2576928 RepID=UPI001BFCFED7|nr:NAD(P)H-hydrate dehydratase [Polynucleobacter sp. AP-Jannik-300A-C4]QWE21873.1 NAD(P)H-hydrate dehydratase [Polynucleobacter sp. AP-Jannik-300A-C4]